jgi:predicted ester cyclase
MTTGGLIAQPEPWHKGSGGTARPTGSPNTYDQAGNRAFYEAMWAAFPGSQIIIDDTLAEGDQLAARFHLNGAHSGEFMGVPPTGRTFVLNGQAVLRFRDGRVVERWTTSDLLGLLIQLGALRAPGG